MITHYIAKGNWIENRPYSKDGHWDINYSDILTQLIQSTGRYCKRYASDLFIDWNSIVRKLEKGENIDDTYIFALRTEGVDGNSFYQCRMENGGYPYHEVWELKVTGNVEEREIVMELNLIAN